MKEDLLLQFKSVNQSVWIKLDPVSLDDLAATEWTAVTTNELSRLR